MRHRWVPFFLPAHAVRAAGSIWWTPVCWRCAITESQLQRMAQAAAIIRRVVGADFRWEQPGLGLYGVGSLMVLLHEPGETLRPYCNYDCGQYDKIEALTDALSEVGLYVEDCTGNYSGVYEVCKEAHHVDSANKDEVSSDVR